MIQNGYPGKTRSLVGDAKFEKLVRRESRISLLAAENQDKGELREHIMVQHRERDKQTVQLNCVVLL